jgi:hypothetical protein
MSGLDFLALPTFFDYEVRNAGVLVRTELDLERTVSELYSPLYRLAFALARNETQAAEFTLGDVSNPSQAARPGS